MPKRAWTIALLLGLAGAGMWLLWPRAARWLEGAPLVSWLPESTLAAICLNDLNAQWDRAVESPAWRELSENVNWDLLADEEGNSPGQINPDQVGAKAGGALIRSFSRRWLGRRAVLALLAGEEAPDPIFVVLTRAERGLEEAVASLAARFWPSLRIDALDDEGRAILTYRAEAPEDSLAFCRAGAVAVIALGAESERAARQLGRRIAAEEGADSLARDPRLPEAFLAPWDHPGAHAYFRLGPMFGSFIACAEASAEPHPQTRANLDFWNNTLAPRERLYAAIRFVDSAAAGLRLDVWIDGADEERSGLSTREAVEALGAEALAIWAGSSPWLGAALSRWSIWHPEGGQFREWADAACAWTLQRFGVDLIEEGLKLLHGEAALAWLGLRAGPAWPVAEWALIAGVKDEAEAQALLDDAYAGFLAAEAKAGAESRWPLALAKIERLGAPPALVLGAPFLGEFEIGLIGQRLCVATRPRGLAYLERRLRDAGSDLPRDSPAIRALGGADWSRDGDCRMVFCADFEAMARAIEQVEASTLFWPMRMKRYVRLARELGHALAAGGGAALAREVDADRDRVTLFLLWPE